MVQNLAQKMAKSGYRVWKLCDKWCKMTSYCELSFGIIRWVQLTYYNSLTCLVLWFISCLTVIQCLLYIQYDIYILLCDQPMYTPLVTGVYKCHTICIVIWLCIIIWLIAISSSLRMTRANVGANVVVELSF